LNTSQLDLSSYFSTSSGLPLSYRVTGNTSICSFDTGISSRVSLKNPGICFIEISQLGNVNFLPARTITTSFNVLPKPLVSQSLIYNPPGYLVTLDLETINLDVYSDSGLKVTLTSNSTSICSFDDYFSPLTVTLNSVGSCNIRVDQVGNANYSPSSGSFTLRIYPAPVATKSAAPKKPTKPAASAPPKVSISGSIKSTTKTNTVVPGSSTISGGAATSKPSAKATPKASPSPTKKK
jgi:hypothetical protein